MANDLNRCEFIGRLGKDPETRYGADGVAVASLSLAVGWKTKEKEGTEWVRVVSFGKLAEIIGQYPKKGQLVYIAGRMRTREYEKDGQKRYVTEIVADQMQMLGGRETGAGQGKDEEMQQRTAPRPSAPHQAPSSAQNFSDLSDDIPFSRPAMIDGIPFRNDGTAFS